MKETKIIRDPEAIQLLADETRMKMIYLLRAKELTVSQIAAELGLTTQTIYHHVKKLKECDMIEVAREERVDHLVESYYRATAGTFYFVDGRCADERRGEKAVEKALATLGAMGHEVEAGAPVVKGISKQVEMLWKQRENPDVMTKIFEMNDFNPFVQRQVVEFAMLMTMTDKDFEKYMAAQRRLRDLLLSARNEDR
ncbi:MAG: winged helix-turn-helix transcriptional regulator [Methanobacteriota archaeon]|nr:MAG: winged helix-turn-helix transcriptional regulator [Euryarchaeota archaeon]